MESTAENLSERVVQKRNVDSEGSERMEQKRIPSAGQIEANRKNGRLGGLGRRKPVDWAAIASLKREGYSVKQIGVKLGVSRWTVQRRIAEALRF